MTIMQKVVTPVKTGVQGNRNCPMSLDSGWSLPRKAGIRGRNDEHLRILIFCVIVIP
jgi:hypothetical protein